MLVMFHGRSINSRDYLAARDEVVAHLNAIAAKASEKLDVKTLFQHRYVSHHEDAEGAPLQYWRSPHWTRFHRYIDEKTDQTLNIRSSRLILAQGFAVKNLSPHPWEAKQVVSLSVRDSAVANPQAQELPPAIYIIGGGKTAMDCAHHLITSLSGKVPIHMFAGRGSWFTVRETIFPTGWRRWFYGSSKLFSDWFIWITTRYRGDNAADIYQALADRDFLHSLVPHPRTSPLGSSPKANLRPSRKAFSRCTLDMSNRYKTEMGSR